MCWVLVGRGDDGFGFCDRSTRKDKQPCQRRLLCQFTTTATGHNHIKRDVNLTHCRVHFAPFFTFTQAPLFFNTSFYVNIRTTNFAKKTFINGAVWRLKAIFAVPVIRITLLSENPSNVLLMDVLVTHIQFMILQDHNNFMGAL